MHRTNPDDYWTSWWGSWICAHIFGPFRSPGPSFNHTLQASSITSVSYFDAMAPHVVLDPGQCSNSTFAIAWHRRIPVDFIFYGKSYTHPSCAWVFEVCHTIVPETLIAFWIAVSIDINVSLGKWSLLIFTFAMCRTSRPFNPLAMWTPPNDTQERWALQAESAWGDTSAHFRQQ